MSVRRLSPSSLNSTKDSSIIKPDNDNKDIIAQININQPEMLIYPPVNINPQKSKIIIEHAWRMRYTHIEEKCGNLQKS